MLVLVLVPALPHSFISLAGEAAHLTTRGHHRSGDVTRAMSARRAKPLRERSEDQTRPSLRGAFAKRSGDTDGSFIAHVLIRREGPRGPGP